MALMLSKKKSTSFNGDVILDLIDTHTGAQAEYTGTNGITVYAWLANITETDMKKSYTDAQVKSSSSASPFYTYVSGNQNLNVYYDNGYIIASTSNCPLAVICNNA